MTMLRRLGVATAITLAAAAPSIPVEAASGQVSGTFVLDTGSVCTDPPDGYDELTFVISGDLEGCWYTNIDQGRDLGPPSGLYFEAGREVFIGRFRGGPVGTFATTYTFTSRWDPDFTSGGTEIWGRCLHLIVSGSGTGGLHDVTGHLLRTDTATDGSTGRYRGLVRTP
jgi:hypothetical protein